MSESEKKSDDQQPAGNGAGANGNGNEGDSTVAKPKKSKAPANAKAEPKKAVRTRTRRKSKPLPPYNVILLDDNHHTYAYVVEMLKKVFGHPEERGVQLAKEVDSRGRVIVLTTHRELAELKRDQIHGFGADWRLEESKGSMTAVIEPAK